MRRCEPYPGSPLPAPRLSIKADITYTTTGSGEGAGNDINFPASGATTPLPSFKFELWS